VINFIGSSVYREPCGVCTDGTGAYKLGVKEKEGQI